jgi:hypothetical protein
MTEKIVVKRLAKAEAKTVTPKVAAVVDNIAESAAEPVAAKPRKKLYVHIGMHKTGTTSIQFALHENMYLLRSLGYCFPLVGRTPQHFVQHSLLAEFFSRNGSDKKSPEVRFAHEGLIRVLLDEIAMSNCPNVILSSENFWHLTEDQIQIFAETFKEFDIEPIFFVRSLADYTDGVAATIIANDIYSMEAIRNAGDTLWSSHYSMDVYKAAAAWANISYDKKIWIENYDVQSDSVAVFFEITGIKSTGFQASNDRLNKSNSLVLMYMKYELILRGVDKKLVENLVYKMRKLSFPDSYTILDEKVRANVITSYKQMIHKIISGNIAKSRIANPLSITDNLDRHKRRVQGLSGVLFEIGSAL